MITLLRETMKQMTDKMTATDQKTMRRAPMPERRGHKQFSKQGLMLSWLVLLVLGVLFVMPGQVLATTDTYSLSGPFTWTAPVGVTSVTVQAWGSGGDGGGANNKNAVASGGGGGGGAYAESVISVTSGNNYDVVVGANGGVSSFAPATLPPVVVAAGGSAGTLNGAGGAGGTVAASTGTIRYSGGAGFGDGSGTTGGGGGAAAGTDTNGASASSASGATGVSGGGSGGTGGGVDVNGTAGTAPGGGGGGGGDKSGLNTSGGAGGAGQVLLTYTASSGTHNLTSFTNNAPASLNPDGSTEYQFATIASTATSGGADVTSWNLTVNDNGTALSAADVTVIVKYGGTQVGSASPAAIGTAFNINTAGTQNGGSNWTFHLVLAAGADGKDVQLTVTSAAGGNDTTAGLPQSSGIATATIPVGCTTGTPTISLGSGVSIGASASTQYTITVNNTDSAGCADRTFILDVQAGEVMTPNDGSFNASAVSGTCTFALAAGNSSNTCKLDVSSTAGAQNGTTLATTVEDTNGSGVTGSVTTTISIVAGLGCSGCHETVPAEAAARNSATGAVVGSHQAHATGWLNTTHGVTCNNCHVDSSGYSSAHRNKNIEMLAAIHSGFYDKDEDGNNAPTSWAQSSTANLVAMGNCDNTVCHGNGDSPVWGTSGTLGCDDCHGDRAGQQYPDATNVFRSAGGSGAHAAHMNGATGIMNGGVVCTDCHVVPAATNAAGHFDLSAPADIDMTSGDGALASYTSSYTATDCSNYCHDGSDKTGNNTNLIITPAWTDTNAGSCDFCHGYPPTNGAGQTHSGISNGCASCHEHVNATDNGFLASGTPGIELHINGAVDGGGCNGCHGGNYNHSNNLFDGTNFWPDDGVSPKPEDTSGRHQLHMEKLAASVYSQTLDQLLDTATGDPAAKQKALCEFCHDTPGGANHKSGFPANVNSFYAIWDTAKATADNGVYSAAADTCATTNCHNNQTTSDGTYGWYDAGTSACVMCHTVGGTNTATTAHPASGIHDVARITGKLHDNNFTYGSGAASTATCETCHTANPTTASGHIDGTNDYSIGANDAVDPRVNIDSTVITTFVDGVIPTCAPASGTGCHIEQWNAVTDHTWTRKWHENAGSSDGTECRGCHGTFAQGWNAGMGPDHTANFDGNNGSEILNNHDHGDAANPAAKQCLSCHVYNDALYDPSGLGWNPASANKHGNGVIEMYTGVTYATVSNTCGTNCHDATGGSHAMTPDSGWTVANLAGPKIACIACHNGAGPTAKLVDIGDPHSTTATGMTCEACHFNDHSTRTTGTVGIAWDTRTMGTDYTADGMIYIKSNGQTEEAGACWACHAAQTPMISEWDGTSATYDYGSVSDGVAGNTVSDLNWFTTNWSSANFNYKNGKLTTKINTDTDTASTHGTKTGGVQGVDDISKVGCTSCHDVHGINLTAQGTGTAPYLRGSWMSSVYYEDGAPGRYTGTGGSGTGTYDSGTSTYGNVPRGSSDPTQAMGGYWIDQNSASHGATTYAQHAGLCTLCHGDAIKTTVSAADVTAIEGLWAGHINPVAGGTNSTNALRNIYTQSGRNGNGTWNGGMWMGAQNSTGQSGARYYSYRSSRQPWVNPYIGSDYAYNTFQWAGVTMNDATVDVDMHNFTCSKCHNPHASRLPRLMITNCLDTERNLWDDAYIGTTNMATWSGGTYNVNYGSQEHAKSTTAQNCHRYVQGQEPGWNLVTPWQ